MIRGIYSATSGLITASEHHDIISINLANINTPSFREIQMSFSEAGSVALGNELSGVKSETIWHKNEIGGFIQTGRSLDLAITESDRYFLLLSNDGQLISRYGHFTIRPDGLLVDPNGFLLLGNSGPIRVPSEINDITVTDNGTVIVDGEEVDRIRIVTPVNNNVVTRIGSVIYKPNDELSIRNANSRIMQGYLETSNIKINDMIIKMILGNRYYEVIQKTIRLITDVIQLNTKA